MAGPAVIQATFSDFKLVRTRSIAQLIFEVPSELGQSALDVLGGLPGGGREVHVGIARLQEPEQEPDVKETAMGIDLDKEGREAIKACAVLCTKPAFQKFMMGPDFAEKDPTGNSLATTILVKREVGMESRTELRTDIEKLLEWRALVRRFERFEAAQRVAA